MVHAPLVEIDEDVAAQDQVEAVQIGRHRREAIARQIEDGEARHAHELGFQARSVARIGQEMLGALGRIHRPHRPLGVAPLHRAVQGLGVDVGAQQVQVPFVHVGQQLAQQHGHGIQLLPGRRSGAPDAQGAVLLPAPAADQGGQVFTAQEVHLRGVAEKETLAHGDARDQVVELRRAVGQLRDGMVQLARV